MILVSGDGMIQLCVPRGCLHRQPLESICALCDLLLGQVIKICMDIMFSGMLCGDELIRVGVPATAPP